MRNILYLLILIIFSCSNQSPKTDEAIITDTAIKSATIDKIDNSKYYTTYDTQIIATERGDTLKYSKADFNKIIDNHPEFFNDVPLNPDQAYYCNVGNEGFGSEAGQDAYYKVYAHFLQQKNGIGKYAQQRKQLTDIYSNINSLFQILQHGGTYFGHQYSRIFGYAEYSVYLLSIKDNIEKKYDISKQKGLYIQSLRQLVEDEVKADYEIILVNEKVERINELNKIVNQLDELISDKFYLLRAQEFHHGHYEYY